MKKNKIALAAAALAVSATMLASMTACGAPKSTGLFYSPNETANGTSEHYKLELFEDGTYEMTYFHRWVFNGLGLTYGRDVVSYGEYTVTATDEDLGTQTVELGTPTRIQMCAFHRNGTLVTVDTANWPEVDADGDGAADPVEYTLYERADTESWESAEAFLAAYGRTYTAECDTVKGSLTVTVNGEQIPAMGAVTPAAE